MQGGNQPNQLQGGRNSVNLNGNSVGFNPMPISQAKQLYQTSPEFENLHNKPQYDDNDIDDLIKRTKTFFGNGIDERGIETWEKYLKNIKTQENRKLLINKYIKVLSSIQGDEERKEVMKAGFFDQEQIGKCSGGMITRIDEFDVNNNDVSHRIVAELLKQKFNIHDINQVHLGPLIKRFFLGIPDDDHHAISAINDLSLSDIQKIVKESLTGSKTFYADLESYFDSCPQCKAFQNGDFRLMGDVQRHIKKEIQNNYDIDINTTSKPIKQDMLCMYLVGKLSPEAQQAFGTDTIDPKAAISEGYSYTASEDLIQFIADAMSVRYNSSRHVPYHNFLKDCKNAGFVEKLKEYKEISLPVAQAITIMEGAKEKAEEAINEQSTLWSVIQCGVDQSEDDYINAINALEYPDINNMAGYRDEKKIFNYFLFNHQNLSQNIRNAILGKAQTKNRLEHFLRHAAWNGHSEVVKELIAKGANVNEKANNGATPLYMAAQQGHSEVVEALIAVDKIDLNEKAKNSETPLHTAIRNGHSAVATALIEAEGIEVNQQNRHGERPLHIAIWNGHSAVAEALINKRSEVNEKTNNGVTPLHIAARKGNLPVVKALIEAEGIDLNQQTKNGKTPLHIAIRNGHSEVVEALINKGANVNLAYGYNFTPLYMAARKGNLPVVKALIEAEGIDLNQQTKNGKTPLHIAIRNGHSEVVKALKARQLSNILDKLSKLSNDNKEHWKGNSVLPEPVQLEAPNEAPNEALNKALNNIRGHHVRYGCLRKGMSIESMIAKNIKASDGSPLQKFVRNQDRLNLDMLLNNEEEKLLLEKLQTKPQVQKSSNWCCRKRSPSR